MLSKRQKSPKVEIVSECDKHQQTEALIFSFCVACTASLAPEVCMRHLGDCQFRKSMSPYDIQKIINRISIYRT